MRLPYVTQKSHVLKTPNALVVKSNDSEDETDQSLFCYILGFLGLPKQGGTPACRANSHFVTCDCILL